MSTLATAAQRPDQPGGSPEWRRNTTGLFFGNLSYVIAYTAWYPFLPLIVRELGVEGHLETWVGVMIGAVFGLTFLLTPVWGGLADHYGKKSMVLRAGLGGGIVFLALGWSPSLTWFIALIALAGMTNGFVAASQALVAANTPPAVMGRALTWVTSGALLGGTLGPALAAGLAAILGSYQRIFFFSGVLCVLGGVIVLLFVRERHEQPSGPFRLHVWADLTACLRIPGMGVLFVLNFIFCAVFFGNTAVMVVYMLEVLGDTESFWGWGLEFWVGAVSVGMTVASMAGMPVWGQLLDRLRPGVVLGTGLVLSFVCVLPVPFVVDPLQIVVLRSLLGLLGGGIQPAVIRMIKERAPQGMDARALSFGTSLYMLGHAGAPLLAGLVGPWLGLRAYFGLNIVMMAVGIGLWARANATER